MPGKRSHGEGSVCRLSNGKWRCQFMMGYTAAGKRNIVTLTAPTKSEALARMREYKENAVALPQEKPVVLFSDFADRWYAAYRTQVEASTYSGYYYTLSLLKKHFAGSALIDMKPMELSLFMNELDRLNYSFSAISKCRAMLIQILDMAEAEDLIPKNYARTALRTSKRALKEQKSTSKDAFTNEEVLLLMQKLPCDLIGYSIRLMLVTGLRLQELLALTPADIAEDGSFVSVNKAVKTVNGTPVLGDPKSATSHRVIPVPPQHQHIAVWLRKNGGQIYLWCAPARRNLLCDVSSVRRKYYKTIESISGIRRLSPHCCRHTYVTLLQQNGVSMETIAKLTGHSDIKTTGHYLHVSNETLEKAVAQLPV